MPDETTEAVTVPEVAQVAAPANPYTLMQQAIVTGDLDVAVMERLMDLQERYEANEARKAFLVALADFQSAVDTVPKTRPVHDKRGAHMYNFASLDDIVRFIRPLLRKHELTYAWDSTHDGDFVNVTCNVRHSAGHGETSTFSVPFKAGAPAMSDQQKMASALSYAKRYSLTSALGISVGEPDNDGVDNGDDGKPVTDEQLGELTNRVNACCSADDERRFLTFLGVERLDDITQANYRKAILALEAQERTKGGAE